MSLNIPQIRICATETPTLTSKNSAQRAVSLKYTIWPAQKTIYIGFFGEVPVDIELQNPNLIDKVTSKVFDPLQKICENRINTAKGHFWQNSEERQKNVQKAVEESIKEIVMKRFQPYLNLTFVFGPNNRNAYDIYISFDPDTGCWSSVGMNSMYHARYLVPSMNFGWFNVATVMHEFGHALGLDHEHKRSDIPIKWNLPLLYLWGFTTQGWNKEKVNKQIVDKLKDTEINDISYFKNGTVDQILLEYDPNSIMLYSFPAYLTTNLKGTSQNNILSRKDVSYLNALYPGNGENDSSRISPAEFYMKVYNKNIDYSIIKFVIKTSNSWYSGTDSQVVLSVYDPNYKGGSLRPFKLDNPGNDFERGQTDTYILESTGIPKSSLTDKPIILSLEGGDDWKVEKISIYYNKVFIKSYTPNVWLGNGKGSVRSIVLENNYGINVKENFQLGFDPTGDPTGFGVTIGLIVLFVALIAVVLILYLKKN